MKLLRTILLGILVVAGLAYLNVIIPAPQTTQARTFLDDHPDYNGAQMWNQCGPGNLKIVVGETPACTSGVTSGINSYTGKVTASVDNIGNYEYKIDWKWTSYLCQNAHAGGCNQDPKSTSSSQVISGTQHATFDTVARPLTCGTVQNDFGFNAYYRVKGSSNSWKLGCSRGDFSNLASTNATFTWCSATSNCPAPTHKTCQNNACVTVNGAGTDTCTGNSDCQPQTHKACQDNACKVVSGPGTDTCTTDSQCQPQTHKACQDNACKVVSGPGSDTCSTDSQCQTHKTCQDNACKVVAGPGENTCSHNSDCEQQTHKACSNNACVVVQGGGSDSCSTDNDCKTETHKACVSNACTLVVGGGSDSCSNDNDCKTPTHRACVSQACTVVLGSGNDSCSQDSDCHVDTCTGTNCGNINITVEQHQQQQQQQAVLGASVAPAASATSLPSTGAGADLLFGLFSLIPVGLKLRKFV